VFCCILLLTFQEKIPKESEGENKKTRPEISLFRINFVSINTFSIKLVRKLSNSPQNTWKFHGNLSEKISARCSAWNNRGICVEIREIRGIMLDEKSKFLMFSRLFLGNQKWYRD
jgi:hypothetical protein